MASGTPLNLFSCLLPSALCLSSVKNFLQYATDLKMHLDIKDGKIWIQRNQTDKLLADELVAMGGPKQRYCVGITACLCKRIYRVWCGVGVTKS